MLYCTAGGAAHHQGVCGEVQELQGQHQVPSLHYDQGRLYIVYIVVSVGQTSHYRRGCSDSVPEEDCNEVSIVRIYWDSLGTDRMCLHLL